MNPDFDAYIAIIETNATKFDGARRDSTARSDFNGEFIETRPRVRAAAFWDVMGSMSRAVYHETVHYADVLGVEVPHTSTTIKPSGTVSKLFGLTEGWHLPSMLRYLRWVQFRNDDPQIEKYRAAGYPVRELQVYRGHTIVGFPTEPAIASLEGIDDHVVMAGDASMADQFKWLRLGEAFWLEGHDPISYLENMKALPDYGNQISYTLKYKPEVTDFDTFYEMLTTEQFMVRCCSVMPQSDDMSAYEYLPQSIS